MKYIYIIVILFYLFVGTSCNNETSFTQIPRYGKSELRFNEKYKKETSSYFRVLLVSNPPKEKNQIIDMLRTYTDSIKTQIDSIENDPQIWSYDIYFYKYNKNTSYFIDHDVYDGGIFEKTRYLDDYYKDYLIGLTGERNKKDSTKWDKYYSFITLSKFGLLSKEMDTIEFHGK